MALDCDWLGDQGTVWFMGPGVGEGRELGQRSQ
jgi:hypothetical protein